MSSPSSSDKIPIWVWIVAAVGLVFLLGVGWAIWKAAQNRKWHRWVELKAEELKWDVSWKGDHPTFSTKDENGVVRPIEGGNTVTEKIYDQWAEEGNARRTY